MQAERPTQLIDPVCGMTVDVGRAEAAGLLLEHEDRTYGFCRSGCRAAFVDDPAEYVARADAAVAPATDGLDAERAAASQPPVDPGICEVAEAAEGAETLAPAH